MAHGQGPGADEALPARPQPKPLRWPTDRVGAIEHPDGFAMLRRRLEHVLEGRDEGVDAAAEVLQVDEDDVERLHHRLGGRPRLAVEAEDRDFLNGVPIVRRPRPCCPACRRAGRAGGRKAAVSAMSPQAARTSRGMGEVGRQRGGMRQKADAPSLQRRAQRRVGEQPVEAESHALSIGGKLARKSRFVVEIRPARRMARAQ